MTCTFASFEHHPIGFPGVVLKWTETNGEVGEAYYTVNGVIEAPWTWHNQFPKPFMQWECERFDSLMRSRFANDASVQG